VILIWGLRKAHLVDVVALELDTNAIIPAQRQRQDIGLVGRGDMNPFGVLAKLINKGLKGKDVVPFQGAGEVLDVMPTKDQLENFVRSETKRGTLPKASQDYYDEFDPKVYYHSTVENIKKFDPLASPDRGAYSREGTYNPRGATYFTDDLVNSDDILKHLRQAEIEDIKDQALKVNSAYDMQDFMKNNSSFDAITKDPKFYAKDPFVLYNKAIKKMANNAHSVDPQKIYTQGSQIYPVKIKTKDVFDYENPDHITKLEDRILGVFSDDSSEFEMIGDVKVGNWQQLEEPNIQDALKKLGFSGYRTNEAGTIGLFNSDKGDVRSLYAKFDPKQEKSGEILATVTPLVTTGTIGALGALSGLEEGT